MRSFHSILMCGGALLVAVNASAAAAPAVTSTYQHVLLVSVDGMHAIDLANYIQNNPTSNFAKLASSGIVYPNTFTTAPSDSYPGMLAQVTGASPKTAGLFYDDSYDRKEYPSVNYYLSQNLPDPGCVGNPGTEVTNFEELDKGYNFATQLVSDITGGVLSAKFIPSSTPTTCSATLWAANACRFSRTTMCAPTRFSK